MANLDDDLNPANKYNPVEQNKVSFDSINNAEKQAGKDQKSNESLNSTDNETLDNQESTPQPSHTVNLGDNKASGSSRSSKALPIVGILTGLISIFSLGMISLQSLPINLLNNIFNSNDSIGHTAGTRQNKVINFLTGNSTDNHSAGVCSSYKLKCSKSGRISNKALAKLAKNGVVAEFDGKAFDPNLDSNKKGYPDKNPSHYSMTDDATGLKVIVEAGKLDEFMSRPENRGFARKIFGVRGAFNMRINVAVGKLIKTKVFNPLGLTKKGGIVEKMTTKLNPKEAINKLVSKIPGVANIDKYMTKINTKLGPKIDTASKGFMAYTAAAIGCLTSMIPEIVTSSVAGVDLESGTKVAQDTLLSPAAKAQSNVLHNEFNSAQSETIGEVLTTKVATENGEMKAAVDDPNLLYAAGISKSKPAVSKYAPGYAGVNSPALSAGRTAGKAAKAGCAVVLSPAVAAAAIAADILIKAGSSATLVGFAGLIILDAILDVGAQAALTAGIQASLSATVGALSNQNMISKASSGLGQPLGAVIGVYGQSINSLSNAAFNPNSLTTDQLAESASIKLAYEEELRQDDIENLSPLDISSQYTFLGSLVYQAQKASMLSGFYSNRNIGTLFSGLLNFSNIMLSNNTVSAATANSYEIERCSYAEEWGYGVDANGNKLAVGQDGIPCNGPTSAYDTMSTQEAMDILSREGFFDETKEIKDSDSLEDLMKSGYIKSSYVETDPTKPGDNALSLRLQECTNFSDGSYLAYGQGCISKGNENISSELASAISVFIVDFNMMQSINGEDVDDNQELSAQTSAGGGAYDGTIVGSGEWAVSAGHDGNIDKKSSAWAAWLSALGGNGNTNSSALKPIQGIDYDICPQSNSLNQNGGGNKFNPNAAASASALIQAYNAAHPGRYLTPGACFRSIQAQQLAYDRYLNGGNLAAKPGSSNHGWGLAIDFRVSTQKGSAGSSINGFSSADYIWLKNNSYKYGWINPSAMTPSGGCSGSKCEAWHFQYVGPL